jgi:hypothetical protein
MENLDRNKDNKYKEPLEVGDRVICVQMDDYAANLHMGDKGTVTEVKKLRFDGLVETFYYVKWDKGSNLPLIDTVDKWLKEKNLRKNKKNIEESVMMITKKDFLNENLENDKYKEPLEVDDRVICIQMDDYDTDIHMGDRGIVTRIESHEFDGETETYYFVKWDKGGRSGELPLMSSTDKWLKEKNLRKNKSNVEESVITKKDFLNENFYERNKDFFKYFNWPLIRRYLIKLRDSGVTNMNGAIPYLYIGSKRIEGLHGHEFVKDDYSDYDDEDYDFNDNYNEDNEDDKSDKNNEEPNRKESFDYVLKMADQIKNEFILGSMKVLESQKKEVTPRSVEKLFLKYCEKAMEVYRRTVGGTIR